MVEDKEIILAAGKMAVAVQNLLQSNWDTLSQRFVELRNALNNYNELMFQATEERRNK